MLIHPEWSAPPRVRAAMTTRSGGVSPPPFAALNLGYATADARDNVMENERRTAQALGVDAASLRWVYQVHGSAVRHAEALPANQPLGATVIEADAMVCHTPGLVCGIKVADCMPVLLAAQDGSVVAAAHAGWRGLAAGVLDNSLREMQVAPARVTAWLGPCIGPTAFEVGEDVRDAFLAVDPACGIHFRPLPQPAAASRSLPAAASGGQKFLCDLVAIAGDRLRALGVTRVAASHACTYREPERFFSHRRDRQSGRMAAFIWLT